MIPKLHIIYTTVFENGDEVQSEKTVQRSLQDFKKEMLKEHSSTEYYTFDEHHMLFTVNKRGYCLMLDVTQYFQ